MITRTAGALLLLLAAALGCGGDEASPTGVAAPRLEGDWLLVLQDGVPPDRLDLRFPRDTLIYEAGILGFKDARFHLALEGYAQSRTGNRWTDVYYAAAGRWTADGSAIRLLFAGSTESLDGQIRGDLVDVQMDIAPVAWPGDLLVAGVWDPHVLTFAR